MCMGTGMWVAAMPCRQLTRCVMGTGMWMLMLMGMGTAATPGR